MQATIREGEPGRSFWPGRPLDDLVVGRVRSPVAGLVLSVVTFGVYHFYYHSVAHGDLLRQLGRRDQEAPWLFAYGGLVAAGLVLGPVLYFLPLFAAAGVFIFLMVRHYRVLDEARQHVGLRATMGPRAFLLWLVPGALILIGPYVAYKRLVEEQNEVWVAFTRALGQEADRPEALSVRFQPKPLVDSLRSAFPVTTTGNGNGNEYGNGSRHGNENGATPKPVVALARTVVERPAPIQQGPTQVDDPDAGRGFSVRRHNRWKTTH